MLLLGSSGTGSYGEGDADAIDLDGTNDYLSRSSDLVGNADGKTFTFSAWVYLADAGNQTEYFTATTGGGFRVLFADTFFRVWNSAGTIILDASITTPETRLGFTFFHCLISVDLTSTTKRSVFINDTQASVAWTTYTNDSFDWTNDAFGVGARPNGVNRNESRLAHVYLDYTYRDLSNVTNRRLFITADRKPASGQAALNPIIYLPMDDPATAHVNQGTGGNFTLNGTIARSGRGPNQFNAPYSALDGSADYLSRTSITGIADGKQVTFSCLFNINTLASNQMLLWFGTGTTLQFRVTVDSSGYLYIYGRETEGGANTLMANTSSPAFIVGRNYHIAFSLDMSDTAKRFIYINGSSATVTWVTYTNANINFDITTTPRYRVGADGTPDGYHNGRLGNVFFDTKYIDLSVPANLAKFVTGTGIDAKPADLGANGELPFGTAPLIYLPMYGNNAGKNYGTGGDFTVNSGPYLGSRGPNEFWGNKADFDGSTGYLARTSALTGVSDGKTFSASFWVNVDTAGCDLLSINTSGGAGRFGILHSSAAGSKLRLTGKNAAGTTVLEAVTVATLTAGSSYFVQLSVDLANTANRSIYVNGVLDTTTWTTYSNDTINLSQTNPRFGQADWIAKLDGKLSEFYFTTDYIDFSQEANRLLFRDAFGNPTDLPAAIAKGTVPNPAIYMRFDPANQGLNSGTGGNFTKSGTITDGGQL